jgi:hypothetical protein
MADEAKKPSIDELLGSASGAKKPSIDELLGSASGAKKPSVDELLGPQDAPPAQQAAREAATKQLKPESGFLGEALSSATFGLSEELTADEFALITGAENAFRMATGKSIPYGMGEARNAMIHAQKEKTKQFRDESPWWESLGADVLGGAMMPGGKAIGEFVKGGETLAKTATGAQKAAQFGGQVARSGVVGGAMGAARGLATPPENSTSPASDAAGRIEQAENDFIPGVLTGSGLHLTGAAMANGLPVAAKYLGKNAVAAWQTILSNFDGDKSAKSPEALAKARGQALDYVRRVAEASGKSLDEIRNSPALKMGKPQLGAEAIGRGGVSALGAIGRRAGETAEPLESTLRQRAMAGPARVVNDLADITGVKPEMLEGDFEAAIDKAREDVAPLFDAAYKNGEGTDRTHTSPEIEELLKRPVIKQALGLVYRSLQNAGKDPEGVAGLVAQEPRVKLGFTGSYENLPDVEVKLSTVETLDRVKRKLDQMVSSKRDGVTGKLNTQDSETKDILTALTDYRDVLLKQVPELKTAYSKSGEYLQQLEAWDFAPKGMSPTVSVKTFMDRLGGFTDAQKEALKGGFISDIYNRAANSRSVSGRLRLADMRTPAFREKAKMILGPEAEAKFQDRIAQEMELNQTGSRMMPGTGSATYEWVAEDAERKEAMSTLARAGKHLLNAAPVKAALESGRLTADVYGSHQDVNVRNETAKILMLPADKMVDVLTQAPVTKSQKTAMDTVRKLLDKPEALADLRRITVNAILGRTQSRKEGAANPEKMRKNAGLPALDPDAVQLLGQRPQ